MKIKNLFVAIAALMTAVFGFTACLEGGSKYNVPYFSPAVLDFDMQTGLFLRTAYGSFVPDNTSAQSLSTLSSGDCVVMTFEENSEYQTGQYRVASNINYQPAGIDFIRGENPESINSYTYPFSSVEFFNESFSTNYKGKIFVATIAKLAQNQALDYYFYTKADEPLNATGVVNIYLQASLPGTSSGTQDVTTFRALDMRNMFYSSGRDTTVQSSYGTESYKYLKINLNYCSAIENGAPVFKPAYSQPVNIYMLKTDL